MFAIGFLQCFLYPILDIGGLSIHWFLCRTPFTRVIFLYMTFSKTLAHWVTHSCFGLNLNRETVDYTKTMFCVTAMVLNKTPNAVLHKNYVIHKNNVLHKHHVLARPVQALFAACRIALSMVAGGTRRRRLNRTRTKKCWGFLCKMLTSFRKSDICTKTYFESHIGGACLLSVTQVIPFKHFQTTKETCPAQAHVANICMFASILSMFCRTVPLQAISRRGT